MGEKSGAKACASPFATGDTVKLREHPKASSTKRRSKERRGQVNDLGYGDNDEDATMGNPQPSPKGASLRMQFTD